MSINPHASLKQFLKRMRQQNRGSRVEYRINATRDGVPEEDKYANDMKEHNHSVNGDGVTIKRVNNVHLDGEAIQRSLYKLRFRLQWSHPW